MSPRIHDPDLDSSSGRPIVSIPRGWGTLLFITLCALGFFIGAAWNLYRFVHSAPEDATFTFLMGLAQLATFFLILWCGWGIPAFAVFKDGIKFDRRRLARKRSPANIWSYGFCSWDEISRCHWSPFQPGQLSVYLNPDGYQPSGLLADREKRPALALGMMISQFIPAPYREAVEKAIRAAGKWDG